jgi:hypothetical protein
MTANKMLDEIKVGYDSMYSLSAPGFEDPAYSILVTKAQFILVRMILNGKNNKNQEGFEETEIRSQGLSALIKDGKDNIVGDTPVISSNQIGVLPDEVFWNLPTDFMYSLAEGAITNIKDCTKTGTQYTPIMIKPISHSEYYQNVSNPYKKPWTNGTEGLVWRITYSTDPSTNRKRHGLITDGSFNVTDYMLRYLKLPKDIVINTTNPGLQISSELDPSTHPTIVEIAIKLLAKAVREEIPIDQLSLEILE